MSSIRATYSGSRSATDHICFPPRLQVVAFEQDPDRLAACSHHQQLKSVQQVAPVRLKNWSRIEALLFLYFLALLVHALLEREVRRGMARGKRRQLPPYHEERECRVPSTERILDTLVPLQPHRLRGQGQLVQTHEPELTDLQQQIRALMRLPASIFRSTAG